MMTTIEKYRLVLILLELLAFLTGLLYRRKFEGTYWMFFIIFLGIIFLNESLSWYFLSILQDKKLNNAFLTYYVIPFEFLFYYWLFYRQFIKKGYQWLKPLPVIAFIIYALSFVIEITFLVDMKKQKWFTSLSYTTGNLMLLVLILAYLLRFSRSDEIMHYKTSNMFWVSVGLLIFFLGSFPYYGLTNFLYENYRQIFLQYRKIGFFLNYTMYLFFTISFLWGRPK